MKTRGCILSVSFGLVIASGFLIAHPAVAGTPSPTITRLTIAPGNLVAVGSLVTLTAAVSSSGGPVGPGLVLFCNSEAIRCKDLDIVGKAQLTVDGTASLSLILPIGTHQIKAEFEGTRSSGFSWSSAETLTVKGKYPTATAINAVPSPATVALRGYVSSIGSPATGALSFRDNANPILPLATLTVGSPTLRFEPVSSTSGPVAFSVGVVADFNGDGKLDQIAEDMSHNTVVLFGNGDGTFSVGPVLPLPIYSPISVVGDFNNDDIPDLAVQNIDLNIVSILSGKGDGTFSLAGSFSIPLSNSTFISAGDFDNDGNADLVITNKETTIWLGNGQGGFTKVPRPQQPLPTVGNAYFPVVVADLNGDGKTDLVFNNQSYVEVWLGNGDGTFVQASAAVPMRFIGSCTAAVVADFNGDGKPDLAVADSGALYERPGGLFLLLGNGDGSFGSPAQIGGEFPTSLASGDFNGDGKLDLSEDGGSMEAMTFLGNGDGTFEYGPFFSNKVLYDSLFTGDFNNDGISDLAFSSVISLAEWQTTVAQGGLTLTGNLGIHNVSANYEGDAGHAGSVSGFAALQGPKAATAVTLVASPTPIAPGEALRLVATVSPSMIDGLKPTGTVTFSNGPNPLGVVQVSAGRAVFSTKTLPIGSNISLTAFYSGNREFNPSVSLPFHLMAGGRLRPVSTTVLSVSPSQSTPQGSVVTLSAKVLDGESPVPSGLVLFYSATPTHPGEAIVGQAQLTPSGMATMKFRPPPGSLGFKAVYQGTNTYAGSESASQNLSVTGYIATSTAISVNPPTYTADVTAHGLLAASGDVSFADATDSNYIFASAPLVPLNRLKTQLSLTPAPPPSVGAAQLAEAVGDFNGDGILDIAAATRSNELLILLGNSDGTFTERSSVNLSGYGISIAVLDFNGDGIPDLAVLQAAGPAVILMGHGDGTFINKSTLSVGASPACLVVGDFNGDGVPDLLTTNYDGTATVLLGGGDGTFRAAPSTDLGSAPWGLPVVADFNGDGIPDVATGVQRFLNGVTLLLGNGDGTFVTHTPPVGCGFGIVAEADFNGDRIADLVLTCLGNTQMLLGNGNATFSQWKLYDAPFQTLSAAASDLNGDGIPDLVVIDSRPVEGYYVDILLGRGDGTFAVGPSAPISDAYPIGVTPGDFNGDGLPDILAFGSKNTAEWFSTITQTCRATAPHVALPGRGTQQVFANYAGDARHTRSVSSTVPAEHTNRK